MKKQNYKVRIENAQQAEWYKNALLAIGEKIAPNYWDNYSDLIHQPYLIFDGGDSNKVSNTWLCFTDDNNPTEITFKELLKIILNEKKPLLISEDGVDLFEGDIFHSAGLANGNWSYLCEDTLFHNYVVITEPSKYKAFSNKQSALDWISTANETIESTKLEALSNPTDLDKLKSHLSQRKEYLTHEQNTASLNSQFNYAAECAFKICELIEIEIFIAKNLEV